MQTTLSRLRICTLYVGQLLAVCSGCAGGQTTVPSSGPPSSCVLTLPQDVTRRYLGAQVLDITWQRSAPAATSSEGTSRLTIDVSRVGPQPPQCDAPIDVSVELSSDDGTLEFSGKGQLSTQSDLWNVQLEPDAEVVAGSLVLTDPLAIQLQYADGSLLTARGTLPP